MDWPRGSVQALPPTHDLVYELPLGAEQYEFCTAKNMDRASQGIVRVTKHLPRRTDPTTLMMRNGQAARRSLCRMAWRIC